MRENDARRLDHKTLEAMRERAVRQVQEGESPEVVARVLGLDLRRIEIQMNWCGSISRLIGWVQRNSQLRGLQRESEIIDAFLAARNTKKIRSFFVKDTLRYAA